MLNGRSQGGLKFKVEGRKPEKTIERWLVKLRDRVIILNSVIEPCLILVGNPAALTIITFIHAREVENTYL